MAQLKQVCTVTNGSQTITVIGVNVAYRIRANNMFMVVNELVPYTVAADAVFDGMNTVVQLTGAYQGASNAMAPSSFVTDFTAPDNLPLISQGDVGTAAVWTAAMYRLQEMIGSVTPAGLTAFIAEINATQAAAHASEAAAKTSETNSKASEVHAAQSESAAYDSSAAAFASQSAAKTSEINSKTSETNASNSAGQARTSATQSGSSADASAASALAASQSQSDASGSAASALASKNAAKTSETNSAASAAAAKTSETNAGASEKNAGDSQVAAAGSAAAALASQNAAKTSETNSKTSETNAAASASSAAADRATVQGIVKSLNELYLGELAADPTTDNNGAPLKIGAEYFNKTRNIMRVYTSTGWEDIDADAQTQAANATASASAAAGSAAGAAASAGAAHTSEQNAKTSETNSKTSETNTAASRDAAAGSAANAKASETNSKTSETNAAASRDAAAASAAHADDVATKIGNPVAKGGDTMTGDLYLDAAKATSTRYGTGGALVLRAASGAQDAPAALTVGSQAGTLTYRGYDGANFQDMASIDAWADATVSSTSSAGYLMFATTPSGSTTKAERMRLTSAGRLLLGSTVDNGTSKLQVAGDVRVIGGVQSAATDAGGQFRAVAGSYGALLRNDGSNVFLMQTASGDQYGTFNNFRPFAWALASGAVTIDATGAGTTFGGSVVHTGATVVRGAAATQRALQFQTGLSARWQMITDASAETGSNAGSDFYIQSMGDSGAWLANALRITRSTGRVWLGNGLDVQGTLSTTGSATVAGSLTAQSGFNNTSGTIYNYGWGGSVNKAVYVFSQDGSKYLLYDGSSYTLAGGGLDVRGPVSATGAVTSTSGQMIVTGWNGSDAKGVVYFGAAAYNKYLYYDGANFNFSGGQLYINGGQVWHSGNLPSPAQTTGTTFSGQVDHNANSRHLVGSQLWFYRSDNAIAASLGYGGGSTFVGFLNSGQSAWNLRIDEGGLVQARGQVWAADGGGRLCEDGNIYGGVWGGYLSTFINNQLAARDGNIGGKVPVRNWSNPNYGYVGSDTGNSIIINWDGNFRVYVDGQYGSALWGTHNFDPGSKAQNGARVQWDSGVQEVGPIGNGTIGDSAPWVVVGGRSCGNSSTANCIWLHLAVLRNQ